MITSNASHQLSAKGSGINLRIIEISPAVLKPPRGKRRPLENLMEIGSWKFTAHIGVGRGRSARAQIR